MNLALQTGTSQIPCERVLQQLYDAQLLPQLLREITIDETIDRVAREYGIDLIPTEAEFERLSAQVVDITPFQGMNSEQLAAITTRTLKLHKFKQAGWGHKVSTYYQTICDQLDRVSYSMFQIEDPLVAQELFFRIQSCEQSFTELAYQYSQHETAKKGGLVGPIFIREVPPGILQIISQLEPGGLSPLFKIGTSYGFVRLNEMHPAQLDENMHQLLLDELFEKWIQAQIAAEIGPNPEISIVKTTQISPAPEFATTEIPQLAGNTYNHSLPIVDAFAPDFAYRETNLTEDPVDESLPTATPEVTVVTEPEERELAVTTGFFFPNRDVDRSPDPSNLTAATTNEPAAELTTDPVSSSAIVLVPDPVLTARQRARKLKIGIGILATIALVSIAAREYLSRSPLSSPPSPPSITPKPDLTQGLQPSLARARAFIRPGDATSRYQAILVAQKIPPEDPAAAEVQQSIDFWSQEIYTIAQGYAEKKRWRIAIGTAKMVQPNTRSYSAAQASMLEWQRRENGG